MVCKKIGGYSNVKIIKQKQTLEVIHTMTEEMHDCHKNSREKMKLLTKKKWAESPPSLT